MKMLDPSNICCFNYFVYIIDKNNFYGDFYHLLLNG